MADHEHRVRVHIDELLERRGLTLTELADRVGITLANLSVLKNGRARAIRFTTLTALCDVLECQPGDLLTVVSLVEGVVDVADAVEVEGVVDEEGAVGEARVSAAA
jgi:putative transcriptional regulator